MTTPESYAEVVVVEPHQLLSKAYTMGFREFSDLDVDEMQYLDLSPHTDSDRWGDEIAPDLRRMAGYEDRGQSAYTVDRKAAAIHPGAGVDERPEADIVDASALYDSLVDAYMTGAYDGVADTYVPGSTEPFF